MSEQTETITVVPEASDDKSDNGAADAPWGLKPDGTPYKRNPAIYAKREAHRGRSKPRKTKAKGPDYRNDVKGLLQLVGMPLVVAGTTNPAFLADAFAVEMNAEPIAEAVNELALSDPRIAAALERLGKVGPYGLLVAAVTPLIAQVLANHKVIPPGLMGTADPDALVESVMVAQAGAEAA